VFCEKDKFFENRIKSSQNMFVFLFFCQRELLREGFKHGYLLWKILVKKWAENYVKIQSNISSI